MPLRDVISQDPAVSAIRRAWATEKLHHACLLNGPSGVGKTMLARAAGELLLCDQPTDEPDSCGSCRACQLISRNAHPDLIVVDVLEGKKQVSVAQIRELRARLEFPPHRDRSRAVIFERAEQMTIEAQNALLKTLEEPTARTHLFLTTSNPAQLLPTIRSRCSELHLAPLPTAVVYELVSRGLADARPGLISLAASLASGSVTAAQALAGVDLEQLSDEVMQVDQALAQGRGATLLELAEQLSADRHRLTTTLQLLALWYRDVMLEATGLEGPDGLGSPAFQHRADQIQERARELGVNGACHRLGSILSAVWALETRNANARLTTEAMLLRMLT